MPVYKDDKRGTWYVSVSYRNMENEKCRTTKRGFATKREAQKWELEFKSKQSRMMSKTFGEFWINYKMDISPRVKKSTWDTKEHIVETKILPYFENIPMNEIKPIDILRWQNELIQIRMEDGREYASSYFKTIQSQLSAIFNHAVRYYDLESNPIKKAQPITGGRIRKFQYWTKEEFLTFIPNAKENAKMYYAFRILYWCGIREGELFALTKSDFDFDKRILSITKTLSDGENGKEFSKPKTQQSTRDIWIHETLAKELYEYFETLDIEENERIFRISKTSLNSYFKKYSEQDGLKKIRIHDLRHSHVSLLIHMGFSAVAIGKRVGHKSERITYYYAHLFPGVQEEIARRLENEMNR